MAVIIQVFEKGPSRITLGWEQEDVNAVKSYNLYVSEVPAASGFVLLQANIVNQILKDGRGKGHISVSVLEAAVQGVVAGTPTFEADRLYFKVTTVDFSAVESSLAAADMREPGIEGTRTLLQQDDERRDSHGYVFSTELQRWHKLSGTPHGALNVSQVPFSEGNYTIDRTFSGTDVATELIYLTGSVTGDYAKLITYTAPYVGGVATKTVYSDSLVP